MKWTTHSDHVRTSKISTRERETDRQRKSQTERVIEANKETGRRRDRRKKKKKKPTKHPVIACTIRGQFSHAKLTTVR